MKYNPQREDAEHQKFVNSLADNQDLVQELEND